MKTENLDKGAMRANFSRAISYPELEDAMTGDQVKQMMRNFIDYAAKHITAG